MTKIIGVKKDKNQYYYLIKYKNKCKWIAGDKVNHLKKHYLLKLWMKEWINSKNTKCSKRFFFKYKMSYIDLVNDDEISEENLDKVDEDQNNDSFYSFSNNKNK